MDLLAAMFRLVAEETLLVAEQYPQAFCLGMQ
jgi:hypothetical protein